MPGQEHNVGYWLTPPDMMKSLQDEYDFTFDPCPYPCPPGYDGLASPWGERNWVNPPFGKDAGSITSWVRKAIAEQELGRESVMILPVDRWVTRLVNAGATFRVPPPFRWVAPDGSKQKSPRPVILAHLRPRQVA